MRNLILFLMFAMMFSMNGCGALNGLIEKNTNPISGAPLTYYNSTTSLETTNTVYKSPFERICEGPVEEVRLEFCQDPYITENFKNSSFDASLRTTSDSAEIDLTWSSPTTMFPAGEYDPSTESTRELNKREILVFIKLISKTISKMEDRLKAEGMEYDYYVRASFMGQADGLPFIRPQIYRGEWGTIHMRKSDTTLNGLPHEFIIKTGQVISNEELAALRSYSLLSYLETSDGIPDNIRKKFEVSTTKDCGAEYRIAKVTISINNN